MRIRSVIDFQTNSATIFFRVANWRWTFGLPVMREQHLVSNGFGDPRIEGNECGSCILQHIEIF